MPGPAVVLTPNTEVKKKAEPKPSPPIRVQIENPPPIEGARLVESVAFIQPPPPDQRLDGANPDLPPVPLLRGTAFANRLKAQGDEAGVLLPPPPSVAFAPRSTKGSGKGKCRTRVRATTKSPPPSSFAIPYCGPNTRGRHRNLIVLPKPRAGEAQKELPNARAAYWERPAFFYAWTPIRCNLNGAERYSDADREASKDFSRLTRHAYGRRREIYFDQNGTCGFMEVWKASKSRVARETFPDQD